MEGCNACDQSDVNGSAVTSTVIASEVPMPHSNYTPHAVIGWTATFLLTVDCRWLVGFVVLKRLMIVILREISSS